MKNSKFVIWHNSRCSKSRQMLTFLEEKGVNLEIYKYLEEKPNETEIRRVFGLLGKKSSEVTRMQERFWADIDVNPKFQSDDELFKLLAENPKGIEKPIVIKDNKVAILGRPFENINDIL